MTRPRRFGRSPARSSTTGRQSPPSSPTPICPPPTTRPSAPCVTPSSPGGSPTATRTEEGSAAYAATLSVLETCRRRGVEPWRYITDLLDRPAGPGPQRSAAPHHPAFSMTGGGERVPPKALINRLIEPDDQVFADEDTWTNHLIALGITGAKAVRLASVVAGSLDHLLPDAVIVSDGAGQFDVLRHGLCWIHAECLIHRLVTVTEEQRAAVALVRHLIWCFSRSFPGPILHPAPGPA